MLKRIFKSTLLALGIGVNSLVALLTVFSAYGGIFSPESFVIASIALMVLPILLIAGILLIIADFFIDKRLVFIIVGCWIASLPSILVYSPVNIGKKSLTDEQRENDSFTFLTYNVLHLWDFRGENTETECNATLDYILKTDADIVNLQELESLKVNKRWKITAAQIDSIKARYPYRLIETGSKQLTLMSKYPFEKVKTNVPNNVDYALSCYKLHIKDRDIHLINVHLKSIGLTDDDKELYKDAIKIPENKQELKSELKQVKSQLISKLSDAFKVRAVQAQAVRSVVDSIGGAFIVAGDFNDVPNCYTIRTIRGDDMNDAYADAAFGPTITYHGDKFYFRIDHVLYRGGLQAIDIERGKISSSDHNPLLTTFLFDPIQ